MVLHTLFMDFMERALELAERVAGGLAPRPPVGAVVVAEDGETIVGEGATQPHPGPHAEAVALNMAKDAARGGTIYCTLEPHQTHLTTPPCTQAIIDARIKRVVCPTIDPNPQVRGHGFQQLRTAGIEVINIVDDQTKERANELIEGFAKHVKTGLPFVTAKWAMSLDGKIATRRRDSKWITGETARAHAHRLRYRSDAVLTGIGTVLADDPRLTARSLDTGKRLCGRPYLRVVIDSQGRMPPDASLLNEDGEVLQVVSVNDVFNRRCNVVAFPSHDKKAVDLVAVIRYLGDRGCNNVLVEAGENLTGTLFDLNLVDKVVAYIASDKIIGGNSALSPIGGQGPSMMEKISRLQDVRIEQLGKDLAIIGYVEYPKEMNTCSAA